MRQLGDPDHTASEHALNEAIVSADISNGYEQYLSILDEWYSDDIEVTSETHKHPLVGKENVRAAVLGVLVPLQTMAERGSISTILMYSQKAGFEKSEQHAEWILELLGMHGCSVRMSWSSARRWNGSRVVYERHYDQLPIDRALTLLGLG
jgi:hypothetical protein